jgi:hypothetical protein
VSVTTLFGLSDFLHEGLIETVDAKGVILPTYKVEFIGWTCGLGPTGYELRLIPGRSWVRSPQVAGLAKISNGHTLIINVKT